MLDSSRFRLVFMGTPEFAVPSLERLSLLPSVQICAVYTQIDKPMGRGLKPMASPVKKKAISLALPVFQPEKLNQEAELQRLKALAPDLIVVVAYGKILRKSFLELGRWGCFNLHSSLLPRWRGAAPIHWALMSGDSVTGVTSMRMAEEMDAGEILLQAQTEITSSDTIQSLHDRLAEMGAQLWEPTLEGVFNGTLTGRIQDPRAVNFAPKLEKKMEFLDPSQAAQVLDRRVRALNPWPGTTLWLAGERLKIKKVRVWPELNRLPGYLFIEQASVFMGTVCGSLELLEVQWEGKGIFDRLSFLNSLSNKKLVLPYRLSLPIFN